jgi:hypothetical protein
MLRLPDTLFLAQLAATLFMSGLIWFVQIVHYPLFAEVGQPQLIRYSTLHANRTTWVVFPPMVVELATALAALLPALRPSFLTQSEAILSAALVLCLWASTGLLQVPLHARLANEPSPTVIRSLVRSNWLRTALWTARATLLLYSIPHPL